MGAVADLRKRVVDVVAAGLKASGLHGRKYTWRFDDPAPGVHGRLLLAWSSYTDGIVFEPYVHVIFDEVRETIDAAAGTRVDIPHLVVTVGELMNRAVPHTWEFAVWEHESITNARAASVASETVRLGPEYLRTHTTLETAYETIVAHGDCGEPKYVKPALAVLLGRRDEAARLIEQVLKWMSPDAELAARYQAFGDRLLSQPRRPTAQP